MEDILNFSTTWGKKSAPFDTLTSRIPYFQEKHSGLSFSATIKLETMFCTQRYMLDSSLNYNQKSKDNDLSGYPNIRGAFGMVGEMR